MRPAFLDSLSWEMAEVYGAVQDRILINLARHFPYIQEGAEPDGSFVYQSKMLAQMGQVNRETVQIIRDGLKDADDALKNSVAAAILDALKTVDPELEAAARQGLLQGGSSTPPPVTANMSQAFQSYYRQSADHLNLVNTVMLESTQQAYSATVADIANRISGIQRGLNVGTGEAVSGVSSYNQAIRHAVDRMVAEGITGFIDHGGHRWKAETYAAMDIKTTMFNTARAAIWERQEQYGNDLYQVSSHMGARPLCYPYQGKVISRTDSARMVTDLDGNQIQVIPQSQTSYGQAAGLFGINCKHYPMPFIPGFSRIRPPEQNEEENAKEYAESQKQRELERKLRYEKRDLEVLKAQGASDEEIKAQRLRVKNARTELNDFCDETGRARRVSRERTPIKATFPEDINRDKYGIPVSTVENEYRKNVIPGQGTGTRENGNRQSVKQHEIDVANELIKKIGGDVTYIDNSGQVSKRDLIWQDKIWEVKRASTVKAAGERAKTGMHQIEKTGGNLIIDAWDENYDESVRTALHNVQRYSSENPIDIIFLHKGKLKNILRYKKR